MSICFVSIYKQCLSLLPLLIFSREGDEKRQSRGNEDEEEVTDDEEAKESQDKVGEKKRKRIVMMTGDRAETRRAGEEAGAGSAEEAEKRGESEMGESLGLFFGLLDPHSLLQTKRVMENG